MYDAAGEITGVCHKEFPREYFQETLLDEQQSYEQYNRRIPENGVGEAIINRLEVDNQWIVPYSPYLLLRYNCHINVEICASVQATKYLYKYVNTGVDNAMMRIDEHGRPILRNEVREFQDTLSIGASEAMFRIFENPMTDRYPSVKRLPIHLDKHQTVYFHEKVSIIEALERSEITELTAFFSYNSEHPDTNLPYISFAEKFIFQD